MHKKYKVQTLYKNNNDLFRIKNISINESDYNTFDKRFKENGKSTEKMFGDDFDRQIKNIVHCWSNRYRRQYNKNSIVSKF